MFGGGSKDDPYIFSEFSVAPGGGNRDLTGKTITTPRLVGGQTTGIFVVAGQSNAANVCPTGYTPTNSTVVDNLNIYDGGTYAGADPLLGAHNTGIGPGNLFTRMADKLITAGKYQRVILIPVAVGSTSISDWTSNSGRLVVAGLRASAVGLSITAYLWMQGENDTNAGTSQAAYAASLSTLIAVPRAAGFNAPWLIGKCTYLSGAVSAAVQAAQVAAVNGTTIFAGADTDTLTGTAVNRQADNTHLSAAGQDSAATLWKNAIVAAL